MATILSPLDNVLELVNELNKGNHTNRRGSSLENAFEKITANINLAKNEIIKHFIDNE